MCVWRRVEQGVGWATQGTTTPSDTLTVWGTLRARANNGGATPFTFENVGGHATLALFSGGDVVINNNRRGET